MSIFGKKKPSLFQRLVSSVTGAAKTVKETTSFAEEMELQAAQKVFDMAKANLAKAKKSLQAKKSALNKAK